MVSVTAAEIRPLRLRAWRMVEAQHQIATRKLVDSNAEHELLEQLLEANKPAIPLDAEFEGLHYLLATAFRYPPLRFGSRFGARHERSIWYGATTVRTTLAEVAFYRLLFLAGTRADIDSAATEHTMFSVRVDTPRGVDLTRPPFEAHQAALCDPIAYGMTQATGAAMRANGVEAFCYRSARDPDRGTNVGAFAPRAFASRKPDPAMQTWHCTATRTEVVFRRRGVLERSAVVFGSASFEIDGRIVAPR